MVATVTRTRRADVLPQPPGAPAAPAPAGARRTQAERVEAMRARLLDATVAILAERGMAELSTNEVVRRAGVSRGALAHHFPTKADLVAAAAQHLVTARVLEFRAEFDRLDPAERTVPRALELVWSFYAGPTFAALLDLTVAARTNPELRAVLADGPDQINDAVYEVFVDVFPTARTTPHADDLLRATLTLFAGMAVQVLVDGDARGHHRRLRTLIETLGAGLFPPSAS